MDELSQKISHHGQMIPNQFVPGPLVPQLTVPRLPPVSTLLEVQIVKKKTLYLALERLPTFEWIFLKIAFLI